jgi:hypothetical protein
MSTTILNPKAYCRNVGLLSGAIIGSVFYPIGFPMLLWALVEPFDSMTEILPMFLNMFSIVLAFTSSGYPQS